MTTGLRPGIPLLFLLLLAQCSQTGDGLPAGPSSRVEIEDHGGRAALTYDGESRMLGVLDATRVTRLAKVILPGDYTSAPTANGIALTLDSPESASAFVQAAAMVDGIMQARRRIEAASGLGADTSAAQIMETLRRYLMVDPPAPAPDWEALYFVLLGEDVWKYSPNAAGLGAVVLAGVLTSKPPDDPMRMRTAAILHRTVAAKDTPDWLTWLAYHSLERRNFMAREDRP